MFEQTSGENSLDKNEQDQTIDKEELELINPELKDNYRILKNCGLINTPEEFEKMCENRYVRYIIMHAKEKNLEYVVGLYEINNTEEFEKMCENKNVKDALINAKKRNLEYVVGLYEINNTEEFEKMCENRYVRDIINHAKEKNIEYATSISNTPEEFEKICENKNVRDIIAKAEERNFQYAVKNGILNINNIFRINSKHINLLDAVNIEQPNEVEIEFLKKLFNNYPNSILNTLETISEDRSISIEKNQDDIFDMLNKLENISPIIFDKFKRLNQEAKEEYVEKIVEIKKEMFKNKPIDMENNPEEKAELISIAYRPIGMSFKEVNRFISELEDRTEDLKDYEFPEDGYDIKIVNQSEKIIKKGKTVDYNSINNLRSILQEAEEKKADSNNSKEISIALNNVIKASPTLDDKDLINLLSMLNNDSISSFTKKEPDMGNIKNLNSYLSEFKEVLGVIFKDNFENNLKQFLNENDGMLESIIKKLNNEKTKNAFIRAIQKDADNNDILSEEYWENLNLDKVCRLLSFFIENKIIKRERTKISKEMNKIIDENGNPKTSRVQKQEINLKAYISKNIGSFFAKASAGICTADDIDLFNRPDHFHINLAEKDKNNNEIIKGNIQAYIIEDGDEKSGIIVNM